MLDPFTPGRVFCVGAAGSGVRAMAELLHGFGWQASGTDRGKRDVLERMRAKGLAVTHDPEGRSWVERPDLLLYSPAVPPTDPARQRAEAENVPQATHIDLLAEMTRRRETIAVAGTHGKSSTAALLVHLLRASGRRVAGFVGAEPVDPGYSFADPDPELLVVEACEWNRHFLRLSPTHAVITGVEFDHPDSYRDVDSLRATFEGFRRLPPRHGFVVENHASGVSAFARVVEARTDEIRKMIAKVTLPTGVSEGSATFAAAAAAELGVEAGVVAESLAFAPALRRRFEVFDRRGGRTLIDDYAHHPSNLHWLADGLRAKFPQGNAVVAFQPHQVLRTRRLFVGFIRALQRFDAAAVLPAFPAREAASPKKCAKIARDLAREAGPSVTFLPDLDALPGWADDSTRPGDALVLAGAGDIDRARALFFPGTP